MWAKLSKILKNLTLIVISVFIAILSAEIYLRFFKPQDIMPRFVENAPYGIRKNLANV
jgi:cellobiose-specific phosphotransferase system component IIC